MNVSGYAVSEANDVSSASECDRLTRTSYAGPEWGVNGKRRGRDRRMTEMSTAPPGNAGTILTLATSSFSIWIVSMLNVIRHSASSLAALALPMKRLVQNLYRTTLK
jgi:hypothetical protein